MYFHIPCGAGYSIDVQSQRISTWSLRGQLYSVKSTALPLNLIPVSRELKEVLPHSAEAGPRSILSPPIVSLATSVTITNELHDKINLIPLNICI